MNSSDKTTNQGDDDNRRKHPITDSLRRFLHTPEAELSRWQFALRYLFVVCRHGVRQLREDRAGQLAAALAFRTLFGLVPILAIGMVLFQAFGGDAVFEELITDIAAAANLTEIKMPEGETTLVGFLQDLVKNTISKIEFKSIGVIGLLLLGWAAIGLLSTIEKSFNLICRAPTSRPLRIRIPLFWLSITVGPILIYYSFSIQSSFSAWVATVQSGAFFVWLLGLVTSFCTTWLMLLMLYRFMPNIRMGLRAAAVGSFVAAFLWTVATRLLTGYMASAFSGGNAGYTVLYSSLGLIPIFMLWVYFIWVIVLFGLEVTSTLESVGGSLLDAKELPAAVQEQPGLVDYSEVLTVMAMIGQRFAVGGEPIEAAQIVQESKLDAGAVDLLLAALHVGGFIHPVLAGAEHDAALADGESIDGGARVWTLARPAEQISGAELLRCAFGALGGSQGKDGAVTADAETGVGSVLTKLRAVQLAEAGKIRLPDLIPDEDA